MVDSIITGKGDLWGILSQPKYRPLGYLCVRRVDLWGIFARSQKVDLWGIFACGLDYDKI